MVIQKTRFSRSITTCYLHVKEKLKLIVRMYFIFDNNVNFIYIAIESKEKAAMKK